MTSSIVKAVIFCVIASVVLWFSNPISEFYYKHLASADDVELIIAQKWNETINESNYGSTRFNSIAVGTNGAIDIIVQGSMLLRKLGGNQDIEKKTIAVERDLINNLKHLAEVFTYFFSKGAGGERFMNDKTLFDKAVMIAKAMPRAELSIGGNAALMAETIIKYAPKNVRVYYGGSVGPALKALLHPRIIVPPSALTTIDEYHVIMEYKKGENWAGAICPIASRFIFSHDMTNGQMLSLEQFVKSLNEVRPELVVLSGLHMLESQVESFWLSRIAEVASALSGIPEKIPIHLELASMADEKFVKAIVDRILPVVNSIGLNEQELWHVCQAIGGPHCQKDGKYVNLNGSPSPGVSNDIMFWLLNNYSNTKNPHSRFDRIHFHTLIYHTVATAQSSRWLFQEAAVASGARIASTQSCGDRSVQPKKVDIKLEKTILMTAGGLPEGTSVIENEQKFDVFQPINSWIVRKFKFYLTPVLVCKAPVKTVGLGDAISSSGLLHSGYRKN